jgi:hypothetical protein
MHLSLTEQAIAEISELARRYIWWPPADETGHSPARQIAQIMRFGTYDDIRRLERLLGESVLAQVMVESQPGWFDDRSWDFWRGRLSFEADRGIPEQRPLRQFAHADV